MNESHPTASTPKNATENFPTAAPQNFAQMKSFAIGLVCVFAVVFVLWGGITLAGEMALRQIQKDYLALTDDASRAIFAKRHANHPLGGLVLLGQANDYYQQGDYSAAKSAYAQAVASGLKTQPILREQAVLGEAFSTYALNTEQGLAELKTIAQNSELMEATRAHAASELAGYWIDKGDWKQAKDYIQLINTFKSAKTWQRHVAALTEIYPALSMKDERKDEVKSAVKVQ